MTGRAITFDFHNTIAACPEWFELEVRRLPSAFLTWQAGPDAAPGAEMLTDADTRYRELRRDIMAHGEELPAETCLERVFGEMGFTFPAPRIAEGVEVLMRKTLATTTPIPGSVDSLRAIHAAGVPLGIVSSAVYHPFLEWTLEAFGVRSLFTTVVTSASAGFYKSRPEIYWRAAELLAAPTGRMVHVGDSLRYDVGGARRAGLGTVWLRHDGAEPAADGDVPDLTIGTLEAAAPDILQVLWERLEQDGKGSD